MSSSSRTRRRFYAGRAGSCYHATQDCQALNATNGNHEIRSLTTAEVRAQRLRPCELCQPPRMVLRVVEA